MDYKLTDEDINEIAVSIKGLYYTGGIGYQERLLKMGRKVAEKARKVTAQEIFETIEKYEHQKFVGAIPIQYYEIDILELNFLKSRYLGEVKHE
jgi:hypothetical protein